MKIYRKLVDSLKVFQEIALVIETQTLEVFITELNAL